MTFVADFTIADMLRREGGAFDLCGIGPVEAPWREVARFPGARLRAARGGIHDEET